MQQISIEPALIPEESRRALAQASYGLIQRILSQPGGREALDKKKAEIAERRKSNGNTGRKTDAQKSN